MPSPSMCSRKSSTTSSRSTEDDIRTAFLDLIEVEHLLVEGSAAMAYAAARSHARAVEGRTVVILCGGNVGTDKLREILG